MAALAKKKIMESIQEASPPSKGAKLGFTSKDLELGDREVVLINRSVTCRLAVSSALRVYDHLCRFTEEIADLSAGKELTLLDGLDVTVRLVGETHATFGWKQRLIVES
jgi:hypothetical protein